MGTNEPAPLIYPPWYSSPQGRLSYNNMPLKFRDRGAYLFRSFCWHEIQTLEILGNFVYRITELNNKLKSVLVDNTVDVSFRIILDIMYIFNYVYTIYMGV